MTTELRVINEGTTELALPHACPTCSGSLDIRISPDGVRSFCGVCHSISRPLLHHDGDTGFVLAFRSIAQA